MTSNYSDKGGHYGDKGGHHDDKGGHHGGDHCGPQGPGCENMIYLGNMPDMDVYEKNVGAEYAPKVLGGDSYGSSSDPLYRDMVEVNANDTNGDGVIRTNDGHYGYKSETISHDADGDGTENTYQVDFSFSVSGTKVTFLNEDGTTETCILTVRIMQDTGGNTFLMPPPEGAPASEVEAMTTRPIVSVEFPTNPKCYDLCYDGIFTDRHCFPCFARGTLIETETGPVAVEDLAVGMMVMTRDRGAQPLRWIGSRVLGSRMLNVNPNMRPIRISAGALGNDLPKRDLLVSPQHRILVRSKIAQKMFGAAEVLIAAKQLLQIEGIDIAQDLPVVEYFHFLFDQHEVVLSEGAETELLYTGKEALESVGHSAQEEIFSLFPELRDRPEDQMPQGARVLASGRMGRKLAVRHAQHRKALVQ